MFEIFSFAEGVEKPADLVQGMKLPGIVTNVTAFGAFVDVGVHQDGLVHISQLADQFVKDPNEIVKVGQKVNVTVMEVDLQRNRIGLSMKASPDLDGGNRQRGGGDRRDGSRPPRRDHGGHRDRRRQESNGGGNDWFSQAMNQAKKR
ncbi:MAG: S1 RNA-binding domain-containing protein [Haloferula sp.]